MNKIQNLLKIGDLRTTGKSDEVVELVLSKPPIFREVVSAILTDDPGIRMRASDAAEKITQIHPEWINPHKKILLEKIAKIKQQEVRWHTAQMLPRLKLTKTERKRVFGLLLAYLEDKSRIVKTSTMQALAELAIQDNTYLNQVHRLLSSLIKEGSPAMKARGKKLLRMFSGEVIPVTFLTLMDIYGRWFGIRISGQDPKVKKEYRDFGIARSKDHKVS